MTVKVKCDKMIRVVGYYGKVSDMNNGKKEEYKERKYMV